MIKKIGYLQVASRRYGGVIYEELVKKILAENFDLEAVTIDSRYFKKGYLRGPEILFNLLKLKGKKDLWLRDSKAVIALPLDRTQGKNIVIFHHLDFSQTQFPFRLFDFFLEKLIYYGLRKAEVIVTVSGFWQRHFLERGYPNVSKIYNPFDLANFQISEKEGAEFKKKYNLREKPIIYLGNCQRAKGVLESYLALKDLDATLVTSGEPMIKIPALNLELKYKDYLCLLKASTLVVNMSKIKEGWSRTCHEAMLLKVPVIGSGRGGMKELLEGGKQIICENFQSLKEKVQYLLKNPKVREKMGKDGFNFAKNFTLEKFQKDWLNLIEKVVSPKNNFKI